MPILMIQRSTSLISSERHCSTSFCIVMSSGSQWLFFIVLYRSYAHWYFSGRMLKNMVSLPLITLLAAKACSAFSRSRTKVLDPRVTVVVAADMERGIRDETEAVKLGVGRSFGGRSRWRSVGETDSN